MKVQSEVARPFSGEALVGRLFEQTLGAFELFNVYIGNRLGLYRALAADGSATPDELAGRGGIATRYAREWLEQQTTAGILEVDDPAAEAELRRYSLPPEHREPLLDGDSLSFGAFMPRYIVSVGGVMPALLNAFQLRREHHGLSAQQCRRAALGGDWHGHPIVDGRAART